MIKYSFCHPLGSDQHLCNFCSGGERGERVQRGHDCSCAFSQPITESTLHLGHFLQLPSLLLQLRTLPQYHRCVSSSSVSLSVQLSVCLTKSLLYVPSSHPASLCPSSCLYVSPRACCMCHHPIQRLSVRPAVCMSHQEPVVCAIIPSSVSLSVQLSVCLAKSLLCVPSSHPASLCPSSCLYVSPRACCMCHHPHCHLTPGSPTSALDLITHVLTLTVTWSPIHPPLHMTFLPMYSPSLSYDPQFTHLCTWPCYPCTHPHCHMTPDSPTSAHDLVTHPHCHMTPDSPISTHDLVTFIVIWPHIHPPPFYCQLSEFVVRLPWK